MDGITDSNGLDFNLDEFVQNSILGYQIKNKITGRLFPSTQRFEIYTESAAKNKMFTVDEFMRREHQMDLKLSEYDLVEVSEYEFPNGWHLITTDEDWK